jgi:hypothetical protein
MPTISEQTGTFFVYNGVAYPSRINAAKKLAFDELHSLLKGTSLGLQDPELNTPKEVARTLSLYASDLAKAIQPLLDAEGRDQTPTSRVYTRLDFFSSQDTASEFLNVLCTFGARKLDFLTLPRDEWAKLNFRFIGVNSRGATRITAEESAFSGCTFLPKVELFTFLDENSELPLHV